MKKIVISTAVATSLIVADTELYSVAHISADNVDNGTHSSSVLSSNSSRFGGKTSYDFGYGLKLIGQLEIGIDLSARGIDDGNGGNYSSSHANGFVTRTRDSFIGAVTDYGTIMFGTLPYQNEWLYDYNLFADQVGDLGNVLGAGGIGPDRVSGTATYISPSVNGFNLTMSYMTSNYNDYSIAPNTNESAIRTKLSYHDKSGFKFATSYAKVSLDSSNASLKDPSELVFSSSYTTDAYSVGGGYAMIFNPNLDNSDRSVFHIGASFAPMSSIKLKTHYVLLNDDVEKSDTNMFAIGADYSVFKNATLYIAYSHTANDSNVAYKSNNWGHGQSVLGTPANGLNPSSVSSGFVYKLNFLQN